MGQTQNLEGDVKEGLFSSCFYGSIVLIDLFFLLLLFFVWFLFQRKIYLNLINIKLSGCHLPLKRKLPQSEKYD